MCDNNNDKNNNKYGGDFITLSMSGQAREEQKEREETTRWTFTGMAPSAVFDRVLSESKEEEDAKTSGGNINTAMLYFDHENKKCIDALEENSSKKSSNTPPPPQSDLLKDIAAMTPEELLENEADLLFVENPSRGVYEPQDYTFRRWTAGAPYLGVSNKRKSQKSMEDTQESWKRKESDGNEEVSLWISPRGRNVRLRELRERREGVSRPTLSRRDENTFGG